MLRPLFDRHGKRLYNFFMRQTGGDTHTSEDLVQETFYCILRSRHTYRADGRFVPWLFAVARSARLTHLRKHRHARKAVPLADSIQSDAPGPDVRFLKRQGAEIVRAALARLSDEKREALLLSRFEDMTYEEIAHVAGCTVGTVKSRVHRALKDLSRICRELGYEM